VNKKKEQTTKEANRPIDLTSQDFIDDTTITTLKLKRQNGIVVTTTTL
jgi:hypothetical protein